MGEITVLGEGAGGGKRQEAGSELREGHLSDAHTARIGSGKICHRVRLSKAESCLPKALHVHSQKVGSIPGVPRCINATAMYIWLNRDDVRQALHIPSSLPNWELCR